MSVGSTKKVIELTEQLIDDGYEVASKPKETGDGYLKLKHKPHILKENFILDKDIKWKINL